MSSKTISFVSGKGYTEHNNREKFENNKDINLEKIKDNIVLKNENLEDAYKKIFAKSIERYNQKQKRSDRKIDGPKGYISKLKKSKNNEKVFHETIVMVGDKYDTGVGTDDGKKATDILVEYAKLFQDRNPNLYVFNSVIHLDESTPHLHINYIPVGTGYKTGLDRKNSMSKALENMGYTSKNRKENSLVAWSKNEREYLKNICAEKGIETKELGLKRERYTVSEYKTMANLILNEIEVNMGEIIYNKGFTGNFYIKKEDLKQFERNNASAIAKERLFNDLIKSTDIIIDNLVLEKKSINKTKEKLKKTEEKFDESTKIISSNEDIINNLQLQIRAIKKRDEELKEENEKLEKEKSVIKDKAIKTINNFKKENNDLLVLLNNINQISSEKLNLDNLKLGERAIFETSKEIVTEKTSQNKKLEISEDLKNFYNKNCAKLQGEEDDKISRSLESSGSSSYDFQLNQEENDVLEL